MKFTVVLSLVCMACLGGCAGHAGVAGNDPPAQPFPWCVDEARAAASHPPLPRKATAEQRQAVRDYYMSKACQQATEQSAEISLTPRPKKQD